MMLYSLTERMHLYVYGYEPGESWLILGRLLMITPLMCIPLYILITLCRVSGFNSWISHFQILFIAFCDTSQFSSHNQNGNNITTPSSALRQAQPHKPILKLCECVIFKAQRPSSRSVDNRNEKMMMEEHGGVWWSMTTPTQTCSTLLCTDGWIVQVCTTFLISKCKLL